MQQMKCINPLTASVKDLCPKHWIKTIFKFYYAITKLDSNCNVQFAIKDLKNPGI